MIWYTKNDLMLNVAVKNDSVILSEMMFKMFIPKISPSFIKLIISPSHEAVKHPINNITE